MHPAEKRSPPPCAGDVTKEFCKSVDESVLKAAKPNLDLPELLEWQNEALFILSDRGGWGLWKLEQRRYAARLGDMIAAEAPMKEQSDADLRALALEDLMRENDALSYSDGRPPTWHWADPRGANPAFNVVSAVVTRGHREACEANASSCSATQQKRGRTQLHQKEKEGNTTKQEKEKQQHHPKEEETKQHHAKGDRRKVAPPEGGQGRQHHQKEKENSNTTHRRSRQLRVRHGWVRGVFGLAPLYLLFHSTDRMCLKLLLDLSITSKQDLFFVEIGVSTTRSPVHQWSLVLNLHCELVAVAADSNTSLRCSGPSHPFVITCLVSLSGISVAELLLFDRLLFAGITCRT